MQTISLSDPDTLHGLLIHEERGFDMHVPAKRFGVTFGTLTAALNEAREGGRHKAAYCRGTTDKVSKADAPRAWDTPRHELFLRDWQRHCIMAMLAEGGATFPTLTAILDRNGIFSAVNDKMAALRHHMQRAGFDYEVTDNNKPGVRYSIVGAHRDVALKLVENEWRDEV